MSHKPREIELTHAISPRTCVYTIARISPFDMRSMSYVESTRLHIFGGGPVADLGGEGGFHGTPVFAMNMKIFCMMRLVAAEAKSSDGYIAIYRGSVDSTSLLNSTA